MSQLTLSQAKQHLAISDGFAGHDSLIQSYIDAAEAWVVRHVRKDLDAEYPGGWPEDVLQAVRFIVGHYYANREQVITGTTVSDVPLAARDLLAHERDLSA